MTWSVARFVRAVVAVVVRFGTLVLAVSAAMILVGSAFGADNSDGLWLTAGESPTNTRWQPAETRIGVGNAGQLAPDWTFTTGGDVSATPAVDGNTVYVPDFAGNLFAIDKKTGMQKWSHSVSDYTGIPGDLARATPAVAGNKLILGDQGGRVFGGANVFAVGKQTGTLLWKTQVGEVGDHPFEIVTSSAVMSKDNKVAYVGVASYEEVFAAFIPGYECCHDRGAIVALSADTGEILWKTYTVPNGFSGGAVWGSTPVIDESRNSLYVGTGNNYSVPQVVIDCVVAAGDDKAAAQACNPPDNHFDSIMALDLKTGAIKWSTLAIPYDAWNVGCIPFLSDGSNCPEPAGPDYDFGQGPTLFTVGSKKDAHQLLGIGQKSGQYWALDPQTGAVVWTTQVGPGGVVGGLQWGSANDGKRIYVADANSLHTPWTLINGTEVTWGFWSALDPATGAIVWQTADPKGAETPGAVSGANGVVFGCSQDPEGHMYALNAATGDILWDYASGGSCAAGASISAGTVFWGSGYSAFGTSNNKLYAFSTP